MEDASKSKFSQNDEQLRGVVMEEKERLNRGADGKAGILNRLRRGLFVALGTFFVGLGGLGIFLPLLPTTPFLLLATACYCRGSKRLNDWLLGNRWFGGFIRNYREGRGISVRGKIFALALLWAMISYTAFFAVEILIIQVILFIIAIAVSIHITTLPTQRPT